MKIVLFFPPHWAPFQPYLSIPTLTAHLRERGHNVKAQDLNIESLDTLFSTKELYKAFDKIEEKAKALSKKSHLSDLGKAHLKHLKTSIEEGREKVKLVQYAKKVLRNDKFFFNFKHYGDAVTFLLYGYYIISDAHYPVIFDVYQLSFPHSLSDTTPAEYSTEGVLNALRNRQCNFYIEYFEEYLLPKLISEPADLYGISITAPTQIVPSFTLAYLIKKYLPDSLICMGGSLLTRIGKELLPSSPLLNYIDFAILYEGETPLLMLVESLEEKKSLDNIPNLIQRKGDRWVLNQVRSEEDPDKIPTPDFTGFPLDKYLSPYPVLPLLTARGCYWNKCAFCQHKYVYSDSYRTRKLSKVIEDFVKLQKNFNTRFFSLSDEAISFARLKNLANKIIENKLFIFWEAYARADSNLSKEIAQIIANSGCRRLSFGLESAEPRLLKLMKKGINIETFTNAVKATSRAGIFNYVWIFWGFPTETPLEAQKTVDYILKYAHYIHMVSLSQGFILEKYTPIYYNPQSFKISKIYPVAGKDLLFSCMYEVTEGIKREDIEDVVEKMGNQIFLNHPQGALWEYLVRMHAFLYTAFYNTNQLSTHPEIKIALEKLRREKQIK